MVKYLCFFLMVFGGNAAWASPESTSTIKSTVAFSFINTSSLYNVNYSLHGLFDSVDMEIEGSGFSIGPGFRLGFETDQNNRARGVLFFELPVSMFDGSETKYADLTSTPRSISGSVVQLGIGAKFGISYSPAKNISFLVGLHLEKVFLSFEYEEKVFHYSSSDPVKETKVLSGKKVSPMLGISISPHKTIDFSVILNFQKSSNLKTSLYSTMLVADEVERSYTKLSANDPMYVELKATVCW